MTANKSGLLYSQKLRPLPLGQIKPAGWLLDQLKTQAEGLSGHLDEFWPSVSQSSWIGGTDEGWERGPYWLDGIIPLAFLLDDEKLKAKVHFWIEKILQLQQPDGWLGPLADKDHGYKFDPWPRFVLLKAFTQYYEATGDKRILEAMQRFFKKLDQILSEQPLESWGYYRWSDLVLSVFWLYEITGEKWLLDLSARIKSQGFDWRGYFEKFPHLEKSTPQECNLITHGVNNAMALKTPAIWYRQSGEAGDLEAIHQMIGMLDRYHGQANGMFTCDEHLAGKNPSQGTELCTVTEYMYSLEEALTTTKSLELADRLELITYNALPATFSPDMWSHQYDQQVNQVVCRVSEDRIWTSNGPDANIFGLEPHFGCCTANMHQGWPKFTSHLWMFSQEGGLTAVGYAPCLIQTKVNEVPVRVNVETGYPFEGEIKISILTSQAVRFPLQLRIPAWARSAQVQLGDEPAQAVQAGTFWTLEREWEGEIQLVLRLPLEVRATRGYNGSISLYRGPLLYSLKIEEDWRQIGGELPHADWEVYAASPWNYALELNPDQPALSVIFEAGPVGKPPFSSGNIPVVGHVKGRQIPVWQVEHNAAGPLPGSPAASDQPLEELTLVPFGCTGLRIAEFPLLAEKE